MPVPQSGTATTVVSADTKEVVRLGIEQRSVRATQRVVKPHLRDQWRKGLASRVGADYCAGFDAELVRERREGNRIDHFVREARCAHA
jgi:hypothetical protein